MAQCVGCGKTLTGNVGNPPACDQVCLQVAYRKVSTQQDVVHVVAQPPRPPRGAATPPTPMPVSYRPPPAPAPQLQAEEDPEVATAAATKRIGAYASGFLLLVFALARTTDIVTTMVAMEFGAQEANPLMASLLKGGFAGMVVLNAALVVILGILLAVEHFMLKPGRLPWIGIAAAYGVVGSLAVTIWNVIQLITFIEGHRIVVGPLGG